MTVEVMTAGPTTLEVNSSVSGGYLAQEHVSSSGDAHLVSGNKVRFRRDFVHATNAEFLEDFDVVIGAGQTATSGTGNLLITTGVTPNAVTTVTSKQTFTVPFQVSFGFKISQKIVNQEFYVELVACDPVTGVVDETVVAAWKVSGSEAVNINTARYDVRNGGTARLQSANIANLPAQNADSIFELSLESDEVWFHAKAIDTTAGRVASYARQSVCPSPAKTYKVRYRVVNGATAPASTTTFTSAFIAAVDSTEIKTEVTGGQGSTNAGQGIPVLVANSPTMNIATGGQVLAIASAAGAGLIAGKVLSAASTNAALVKTANSRLYGYQFANTSSSWRYVKFFNLAAAPVPGTSVPVMQIALPPNATVDLNLAVPIVFSLGIGISITGAPADLDATAILANEVVGTVLYV